MRRRVRVLKNNPQFSSRKKSSSSLSTALLIFFPPADEEEEEENRFHYRDLDLEPRLSAASQPTAVHTAAVMLETDQEREREQFRNQKDEQRGGGEEGEERIMSDRGKYHFSTRPDFALSSLDVMLPSSSRSFFLFCPIWANFSSFPQKSQLMHSSLEN